MIDRDRELCTKAQVNHRCLVVNQYLTSKPMEGDTVGRSLGGALKAAQAVSRKVRLIGRPLMRPPGGRN